jgi:hypothetical protein
MVGPCFGPLAMLALVVVSLLVFYAGLRRYFA